MNDFATWFSSGLSTWVGTLLGSASLFLAVSFPLAAQQPPHTTERTLYLASADLDHIHSRLGDGQLTLIGEPDREQVEVQATLYYYAEESILLSLEQLNGEARLEGGFIESNYTGLAPYMDVVIRVPSSFSAAVRHGNGNLFIQDLTGMVSIESGSGDIDVSNVGGVRIEHSSGGKVSTQSIQGPVRISQRRAQP
ncbi:hypothetical protein [Aliidiomarina soli]|uniref:Adhesin domain-containing protein n=1 Tax=Aliidiomarina soli TaxID=1928574 RepID=A0A432WJJ3_9GAMM|nr:hypothetical protein [Aliidiomarina soli]RUO33953.1 hypothetical protein CWE14_05745 [Aliidiomarina soli]